MLTLNALSPKDSRTDKEGHILVSLWEDYYAAQKADRPKQMSAALDAVKAEARTKGLVWDFFDAAVKKTDAEVSVNWKLSSSLNEKTQKEIEELGEPLAVYFWHQRTGLGKKGLDYLKENREKLSAGRNPGFYSKIDSFFGDISEKCPIDFANDYEFLLWYEYSERNCSEDLLEELRACLNGSYPNAAVLKYEEILRKSAFNWRYYGSGPQPGWNQSNEEAAAKLKKACGDFEKEYSGRAVTLYASAVTLNVDKILLDNRKDAAPEDYKALYSTCLEKEKERRSFCSQSGSAEEKLVGSFHQIRDLADELKSKHLRIYRTGEREVRIVLRNIPKVNVEFAPSDRNSKSLMKETLVNSRNSFYVEDTLTVSLPLCDDGAYQLKASGGGEKDVVSCSFYRLSLAVREDADQLRFYVADQKTGRPSGTVDLQVFKSGKLVEKAEDVKVDGFTPVPENLAKLLRGRNSNVLEAVEKGEDGFLRKSKKLEFWSFPSNSSYDWNETGCRILTDKSAYNPGETVMFKVLVYNGDPSEKLQVLPAGEKLEVRFIDPEGKEVQSRTLETNEFGSVASEFPVPEDRRNGSYTLQVNLKGKRLSSKNLVVDEFVLPTCSVTFDELERVFFPGDTVRVSGQLQSFSGHPLSSAKMTCSVSTDWSSSYDLDVRADSDGRFSILVPTKDKDWYCRLTLRVTDGTGETLEFSKEISLGWLSLNVEVRNAVRSCGINNAERRNEEPELVDLPYIVEADAPGQSAESPDWSEKIVTDVLSEHKAELSFDFSASGRDFKDGEIPVEYSLTSASGKVVSEGSVGSGTIRTFALEGDGEYLLKAVVRFTDASGKERKAEDVKRLLVIDDNAAVIETSVESVFKPVGSCADGCLSDGERISVQIGAGDGPLWAVAELFGDDRQLLDSRLVSLSGESGKEGSLMTLDYSYTSRMPDAVLLKVFYFRAGGNRTYSKEFRRERPPMELPLSFSSFRDKALPATAYSFTIKSLPGAELAASVFDISSESIAPNIWIPVSLSEYRVRDVRISAVNGTVGCEDAAPYYGTRNGGLLSRMTRSVLGVQQMEVADSRMAYASADGLILDEDSPAPMAKAALAEEKETDGFSEDLGDVKLRSDFSSSLAFEPFLYPDDEGNVSLDFRTSDKLSTFAVQVFAHDREMRNAVVRREMVVSLPVKISVVEPGCLYESDRYVLHATVSNISEAAVSGQAVLQVYSSADHQNSTPYSVKSKKVSVPAGASVELEFDVPLKGAGEVGLKLVFADAAKTFSDGVFVCVPVFEAEQTLTESHSAVLLSGMDRKALLRRLEAEFTGTTANGAKVGEVDIRQMILDALPSKLEPSSEDILSMTESFYVRKVAVSLGAAPEVKTSDDELLGKILSCRNADGGFAWFEGMRSSEILTAVVLERFAKLRDAGLFSGFDAKSSVKFLDDSHFLLNGVKPFWTGSISDEQYAFVRSLYAGVPFEVSLLNRITKSEFRERYADFRKFISDYLVPAARDGRGLQGQILSKARRLRTLVNLVNNEGGESLASSWGLKFAAVSRMSKSITADVASLLEYSVEHRSGGRYYPNAVMPWRGLLESEAYAHSLLCDLFSDSRISADGNAAGQDVPSAAQTADGIRLWLMLQKETQKWGDDPAFVDALNSVLSGPEGILATKVLTLTKTYSKPFDRIVSAGNGFTIERKFFKVESEAVLSPKRVEVRPGDQLSVGDKLVAEYRIWNEENRSFVRLVSPREACLRPVEQLSGRYGWRLSPLSLGGFYQIVPQGYRNVRTDRTEYYFDVYPEESTVVSEEFFVTQEGRFSAPVVTVESLYAPHYRANGSYAGQLKTRK